LEAETGKAAGVLGEAEKKVVSPEEKTGEVADAPEPAARAEGLAPAGLDSGEEADSSRVSAEVEAAAARVRAKEAVSTAEAVV
jgi:hypothetical protein